LAETVKNDLVLVDGIDCMEGNGPVIGNPVCMNVVLAGRNLVSVDAVCSWLMGFDPNAIPHIKVSSERGLGSIDPASIKIVGDEISDFRRRFEPPYSLRATFKSLKSIKDFFIS
jgi:uncharacterized protein (DUF362 family)